MKLSAIRPPRLYAIADAEVLGEDLPARIATMAASGVGWIQVRAKRLSGTQLYRMIGDALRRLEGSGTALWVDDRADLAALFPAVAGVHVGQRDLVPRAVRRVVGDRLWIGRSTHDPGQVRAADADPDVDVVAFGPVYPTVSKERPDPAVGLEGLREARRRTGKPLVAIGGIEASCVAEVLAAGADTVAVIGAACRGDVRRNCERLLAAVARARRPGADTGQDSNEWPKEVR